MSPMICSSLTEEPETQVSVDAAAGGGVAAGVPVYVRTGSVVTFPVGDTNNPSALNPAGPSISTVPRVPALDGYDVVSTGAEWPCAASMTIPVCNTTP